MPGLTFIPGLSQSSARLIEAVGIDKPFALAQQDPAVLVRRLAEVNRQRRYLNVEPTLYDVCRWVENARALVESCAPPASHGIAGPPRVETGDFNMEDIPEVIVLDEAPVPPSPPPPELNRPARKSPEFGGKYVRRTSSETFEVASVDGLSDPAAVDPKTVPLKPQLIASNDPNRHNPEADIWKDVDPRKFKDFTAYETGTRGIQPLPRDHDGAHSRHVARRDDESRRIRRGVPYPRPWLLTFGALMVILWRVLFLVVLVGTPLVLWPAFVGMETAALLQFLWVIGLWLVVSGFYLYLATRIRCRVCTNHIFFSKRCFKNVKAHRVPCFGLVGSLAVHALVFGWFRCMYCGTAIRVKR
jgi:hypothetical protein